MSFAASGYRENLAVWARRVLFARFDVVRCLSKPEHHGTITEVRRSLTALTEKSLADTGAALDEVADAAQRTALADLLELDVRDTPGVYRALADAWDALRRRHPQADEVRTLHHMIESDATQTPERLLDHVECAHWLLQVQMACQYFLRAPLGEPERPENKASPLTRCDCDHAINVIHMYSGVLFGILRERAGAAHRATIDEVEHGFVRVTHHRLEQCRRSGWPPTPLLMDLLKLDPSHIKPLALHLENPAIEDAWYEAVIAAHADGQYWRDILAARQILHDHPHWFIDAEKTPESLSCLLRSCVDAAELRRRQLPAAEEAAERISLDYFGHGRTRLNLSLGTFIVGSESQVLRQQMREFFAADDSPVIRLNLSGVKQVSSLLLSLLLEVQQEVVAHHRELVLEGVGGDLHEMLQISGLHQKLAVINNSGWDLPPGDPAWAQKHGALAAAMPTMQFHAHQFNPHSPVLPSRQIAIGQPAVSLATAVALADHEIEAKEREARARAMPRRKPVREVAIIVLASTVWSVKAIPDTWMTRFHDTFFLPTGPPSMPIDQAVKQGNAAQVKANLKKGVALKPDDKGLGTLSAAAIRGDALVVEMLLDAGAKVDERDVFGSTPLHWAAGSGRKEVVELLLERGADLHALDRDGNTALSEAQRFGHKAVADLLIARGARPRPAPPPARPIDAP